jgi:hypothetical protein
MKVAPTLVAMVPDSSAATGTVRDSAGATVAER